MASNRMYLYCPAANQHVLIATTLGNGWCRPSAKPDLRETLDAMFAECLGWDGPGCSDDTWEIRYEASRDPARTLPMDSTEYRRPTDGTDAAVGHPLPPA
jgi:hypothetical protein